MEGVIWNKKTRIWVSLNFLIPLVGEGNWIHMPESLRLIIAQLCGGLEPM